jgi:hypothetical protein
MTQDTYIPSNVREFHVRATAGMLSVIRAYVVWATSERFGVHAGSTKINMQNEERICIITCITLTAYFLT